MHAWDEGVAFYAGSLEGPNVGGSSAGKMVYRLAEKRCANFGTCGLAGTSTSGTAKVNLDLFPLFAEGARLLERGEKKEYLPITGDQKFGTLPRLDPGTSGLSCPSPLPRCR